MGLRSRLLTDLLLSGIGPNAITVTESEGPVVPCKQHPRQHEMMMIRGEWRSIEYYKGHSGMEAKVDVQQAGLRSPSFPQKAFLTVQFSVLLDVWIRFTTHSIGSALHGVRLLDQYNPLAVVVGS